MVVVDKNQKKVIFHRFNATTKAMQLDNETHVFGAIHPAAFYIPRWDTLQKVSSKRRKGTIPKKNNPSVETTNQD